MHLALITAGGAGMFCGSCMHDNTLARALIERGHEVSLIPTYTPIRVDEQNVSSGRVFLGGVNVYLDTMLPGWKHLPGFLTRWLDSPALLSVVSRFGVSSDARNLGRLTVSLLEGSDGPQKREIEELIEFLAGQLKPDVVLFSNALIVGLLPKLKQAFPGPVYCLLQGDDIFLQDLIEPYKQQSLQLISQKAQEFDGFLTHSAYYRTFMAELLSLPREKMHVVPLGIDLSGHDGKPRESPGDVFTIGYFARICPEKGLHRLVEAFRLLRVRHPQVRLRAGGYLGARDRAWFDQLLRNSADLGHDFEYLGSPATHDEKVAILKSFDVLSVPTEYREPKGLYVLEALANGVPVVQPRHGAFPEMIEATGGGLLVTPGDAADLAAALERLLLDSGKRRELAHSGWKLVRELFGPGPMAEGVLQVLGDGRHPATSPRHAAR